MTQYEKDLAAVEQDASALQFVQDQTPEICLLAVKQSGNTIRFVKNQTPEICIAALKENKEAAAYLKAPLDDKVLRYLVENNIKFDKRLIKKNIPDDLKLLLVLNYGISPSKFK